MRSVALPRDPSRDPSPAAGDVRRLDLLTAPAVTAYLQRSDAAVLALGPTEAHGRHLPLGCDYLIALATDVTAIATTLNVELFRRSVP